MLRTRQIGSNNRSEALAAFRQATSHSFNVLTVSDSHFRVAAKFADQYDLGLRGGDALHLAIAADHGATLCTLDHRLAEGDPALGVKTLRP